MKTCELKKQQFYETFIRLFSLQIFYIYFFNYLFNNNISRNFVNIEDISYNKFN